MMLLSMYVTHQKLQQCKLNYVYIHMYVYVVNTLMVLKLSDTNMMICDVSAKTILNGTFSTTRKPI